MKQLVQYIIISSLACIAFGCADSGPSSSATPTIVTQDNFARAFTNMTSPYFDTDDSYEVTFVDPKAKYFWSATVYNGDGRMFNDKANISSEMNPVKNADGTYTLRFGCDGQPNNIPIREGNTTGKFNVLMRHYGPSKMLSDGKDGYNSMKLIRRVK